MTIMKIRGIQKSFDERTIIQKADFDIKQGSRIGLVGNNGSGKTTLANIIYGDLLPDGGSVETYNGSLNIGYLKQSTEFTVDEYQYEFSSEGKEIFLHTSKLGMNKVLTSGEVELQNLSGGEKLKLALARVWSSKPELLILDEPTNHLDLKGLEWLIKEVKNFNGTVLVISHDRHFLDRTVNEIIEIEDGVTNWFNGNYSDYRQEKQRLLDVQAHQYMNQQKYKEQIQQQISNLRNWSEKAHVQSTKQGTQSERRQIGFKEYHRVKAKKMDIQIKSKMKRLNQELLKNEIKKPREEAKVAFQFHESKKRGKRIVEVHDLEKNYGGLSLFKNSKFYLNHGERIGVLGVNGSGKTTLLHILLGKEEVSNGTVWLSESVKIGYLSQDVSDLPSTITALEYTGLTDNAALGIARTIFANIGMAEEKLTVPIANLSLGERTRIKLATMLLNEVDFLILDEPTNHLDLASRENLEKTLMEFKGSILIVSHDVYFLNKISDKLLVIENNRITRKEIGLLEYNKQKPIYSGNKETEEKLMILQNDISAMIGKLSLINKDHPEFSRLDDELTQLFVRKKELTEG